MLVSLEIVIPFETMGLISSFSVPRVLGLVLKKGTAFKAEKVMLVWSHEGGMLVNAYLSSILVKRPRRSRVLISPRKALVLRFRRQ